ncbi:molecular chaperone [Malassezia nana]|uniref:Molecular chaperone n=1 Tax=Malassezia nana TaxID=180528 RepID=A0AAF0EGT6_9BASI|nr:molecular chaperone [Malassezia nana]
MARRYTTQKACAHCGTSNADASLQCQKCETLQPLPPTVDYYEVLGMPRDSVPRQGWQVDLGTLKSQWRRALALTHPDRLVHKPEKEQHVGAHQSAILNKAYETIRHPLSRVVYLLERQGVEATPEGTSMTDPAFLMQVMELQEALEEAEEQSAVEQVDAVNQSYLREVLSQLDEAFATTPLDTERVQKLAIQLRYWTNIDKAIRECQPGKRPELFH